MTQYRPATLRDGILVANKLRKEDRAEVEGLGRSLVDVPLGLLISEHPTYFFDKEGNPAGIAGIVRQSNTEGLIWMLCTDAIHNQPITFIRQAKSWLKSVEKDYTLLWNFADTRNHTHHKLLKHLGFKALRTVNIGPDCLPYYEIVKLSCA